MKALITGASSGIGLEFARQLKNRGYKLILVARRKERLEELEKQLNVKCEIVSADLSVEENCKILFERYPDIDVLINNAGFGVFGNFTESDLDKELEMIDLNIKAVHILTKLYIREFKKKNKGYILNVASSAAFFPGPLFAGYYASKSYVYKLSSAIYEELKKEKSNIRICTLCPGPVDTEFNDVAGVQFSIRAATAEYVAEVGLENLFKGKRIAVPTFTIKLTRFFSKLTPDYILAKITYLIQKSKVK